ncbi:hypothetical protein B9479_007472 [Cryptococcus floricola]|uniref:Uncharacterized protein n=1 Tax=Cryptococcus floricola TaxID=2591691 RepID=A0A5D3APD8_9TREE|nr:hypothetical protein B9479_007472 [Cryptococcus floricola]
MSVSANTPSTRSPLSTALLVAPSAAEYSKTKDRLRKSERSCDEDSDINPTHKQARRGSLRACTSTGDFESPQLCEGAFHSVYTAIQLPSSLPDESSSPPSLPTRPSPARIHRPPPPAYEHSCCSSFSSSSTLLIDLPPPPPMFVRGKKSCNTLEVFSNAHLHTLDDMELGYQQYVLIAPPSSSFSGRKGKGKKNEKKGKEGRMVDGVRAPRWAGFLAVGVFLGAVVAGVLLGVVYHDGKGSVKS